MSSALCHFELVTTDASKCKTFYGAVFGWQFDDRRMPGYTLIQTGQEPSGGILPNAAAHGPGLNAYFSVASIDDCLKRVAQAGGEVLMAKTAVPGVGHMAIFADPEGISVGVIQPA